MIKGWTMKKVGVIGLGNMGSGMALSLQKAGFQVHGYDPSDDAAARMAAAGVGIAASPAALAGAVEAVLLSLPNSAVVESVVFGSGGLLSAARKGLFVIDTSTADPASTRKVAQALHEAGMVFLDAPVSGGPKGAAAGTLTMVLGGRPEDIAAAESVLAAVSAKRVHVGPAGAGHVAKLLNNMLCGAHLLLAAEAARIARAAGLDEQKIFDGINAGSGRSAVTEVNFPTWVFNERFDSGFTMKLMRKDVGLALGLLRGLGVPAPMAETAARLWKDSAASIADDEDFNRITGFIADQR